MPFLRMFCYMVIYLTVPCFLYASMMYAPWSTLVSYVFWVYRLQCNVLAPWHVIASDLPWHQKKTSHNNMACIHVTQQSRCSWALLTSSGYIAQWSERLTADQQVPGSNSGVPFVSLPVLWHTIQATTTQHRYAVSWKNLHVDNWQWGFVFEVCPAMP